MTPNMICRHCNYDNPDYVDRCQACYRDLGFPNVRAARRAEESAALDARWAHAYHEAARQGTEHVLRSFEEAVRQSKAVLCRQLGVANWLISNDNVLFGTFWLEIEAGMRSPEQNAFDQARGAVDATFFPYYHREIRFAALSIDEQGPLAYGACSIVLKDSKVAHRSTVFEENTLVFARRFGIIVGSAPPLGYSAVWDDRQRLAVAKLHERINGVTDTGRRYRRSRIRRGTYIWVPKPIGN
jgi:hypothetical protein